MTAARSHFGRRRAAPGIVVKVPYPPRPPGAFDPKPICNSAKPSAGAQVWQAGCLSWESCPHRVIRTEGWEMKLSARNVLKGTIG
jgi:hypothetical protein